jgi:hypothetical protein
MTRSGQIAIAAVTAFAANIALIIIQGGGLDNGYGRLFLIMLAAAYALIAIVILIFDTAWRPKSSARHHRRLAGFGHKPPGALTLPREASEFLNRLRKSGASHMST